MKTKELPLELPQRRTEQSSNARSENATPEITVKREIITPEIATDWLENRNPKNRRKVNNHVKKMAKDITSDDWMMNGQGIHFDWFGNLMNGQHRLEAIVFAGKPIELFVFRGLDPKAFSTMDDGRSRKANDTLYVEGCPHPMKTAAAIRLILKYKSGSITNRVAQTNTEILKFYQGETEYLDEIATKCVKWYNSVRIAPPSRLIALYYMIREAGNSETSVDWFFTRVCEGFGLEPNTPGYALRTKLLKLNSKQDSRLEAHRIMGMWVKCWNYSKRGKAMKSINYPVGSKFPKIL